MEKRLKIDINVILIVLYSMIVVHVSTCTSKYFTYSRYMYNAMIFIKQHYIGLRCKGLSYEPMKWNVRVIICPQTLYFFHRHIFSQNVIEAPLFAKDSRVVNVQKCSQNIKVYYSSTFFKCNKNLTCSNFVSKRSEKDVKIWFKTAVIFFNQNCNF